MEPAGFVRASAITWNQPPLYNWHVDYLLQVAEPVEVGYATAAQELEHHWGGVVKWWAQRDLNPRPSDYESPALTTELWAQPG